MKNILSRFKARWNATIKLISPQNTLIFKPSYRLIRIEKNRHNNYEVIIQLIGKAVTFRMKPEEILADDKMTDQFSPRDIRTLTYLGYLDINSPKYRILAQRLSEHDNRIIFAVRKKGDKKTHIKTAAEISCDKEIIKNLDQYDAHMVGYAIASETMQEEQLAKETLCKKIESKSNPLIKKTKKISDDK